MLFGDPYVLRYDAADGNNEKQDGFHRYEAVMTFDRRPPWPVAILSVTAIRLVAMVFVLCGLSAWKQSPAHAQTVDIVTTPFPPYVVVSEDSNYVSGPAVDVVRQICNDANIECRITAQPWARAFAAAQAQPDTLIFSIARRSDREGLFRWVGTVSPYHVRLFSLRGSDVPVGTNWDALKTFQIAGQLKDVKAEFLQNQGFDVDFVPSAEATLRLLYAGRADLVAGDALSLPYRAGSLQYNVDLLQVSAEIPELSSELYLAASRSTDPNIVTRLENALGELKKSGVYQKIWAQSLPEGVPSN